MVLPGLVLLVEVKSARPTAGLRLGPQEFGEELQRKLGKAFRQIDKSAKLIEDRHPAFARIPVDRPAFGIGVPMEPYHLINAPDFRSLLPATTIPTAVASASELEDAVVAVDPGLEDAVVSTMRQPPPGGWSLRDLIGGQAVIKQLSASQALCARLAESLASPPEEILFHTYAALYSREGGEALPALLPQVYLHDGAPAPMRGGGRGVRGPVAGQRLSPACSAPPPAGARCLA
ncbi:hypothetical protein [Streptomyces sp. NPDC005548]|uniref:hypothetical protein n=1 Tax=Streptomyces sp. NPDC005548 TaxID=3364724 RepID=UPI00369153D4